MKKHWPIIFLLLISILFFLPDIYGGKGFLYGDNFSPRIPTLTFWKQEVISGRFPFWNPYILGGIPFFADLSNNTLAPTNIFYLIFSVPVALTLLVIFFVSLSAVFTYLFVKSLTKSELSGLFSAITFAFSGTVVAAVNDINSLQGIAFIPIIFFAAQKFVKNASYSTRLWLIISLSLQFISSHPQYSYYTWIMTTIYLFVFLKQKNLNKLFLIGKIFLFVFGLIAIQLLPFLELSSNIYRPKSLEFGTQNHLQLIELPSFLVANIYGSWRQGSSWGPGSQLETGLANTEGYVGVFPLLIALFAIFSIKKQPVRFWAAVVVVSFLFSLGSQTPLFFLARDIFPLSSKFRSPIRILVLYSFSISILAGIGLNNIQRKVKS